MTSSISQSCDSLLNHLRFRVLLCPRKTADSLPAS